jgi:hypothetical protein
MFHPIWRLFAQRHERRLMAVKSACFEFNIGIGRLILAKGGKTQGLASS